MSAGNRNPKPDLDYKRCIGCGGILSMRRCPVFLIDELHQIVGPYHSGCAERVAMDARRRHKKVPRGFGSNIYGWLPAREETLPW